MFKLGWTYALGGGHGPLVRSLGLGADNIVSVDLIAANSTRVTARAGSNDVLFCDKHPGYQ
eukprot:gene7037-5386_t